MDDKMYLLKPEKKCNRVVRMSKHERISKDNEIWWNNVFNSLEVKHFAPLHTRESELLNCFDKTGLSELQNLGINIVGEETEAEEDLECEKYKYKLAKQEIWFYIQQVKKGLIPDYVNPYLNFIRKSEKSARIWKPPKRIELDTLSLRTRAENLAEQLATDFDEWFQSVGDVRRKSEITKDVILELFQMMVKHPAATSLRVKIRELGCVTQQIADATREPKYSVKAAIHRQIRRDIAAQNKEPSTVAFYSTLPEELRRKPFTEDVKDKWLKINYDYESLDTMQFVWEGITNLHSTRQFSYWLVDHPDIPPPKYLKDNGFLEEKFLMEPILSMENVAIEMMNDSSSDILEEKSLTLT